MTYLNDRMSPLSCGQELVAELSEKGFLPWAKLGSSILVRFTAVRTRSLAAVNAHAKIRAFRAVGFLPRLILTPLGLP